jgi:hypothetical protein
MAARHITASNAALKAAIAGGLAAGAIDIVYAIAANSAKGVAPDQVLQAVASGLLGPGAFQGGAATAALGLLLHFILTIVMAALFIAAARSIPAIRQHLAAAGLIYGAIIYFAMRWAVVPLSRFPGDLRVIHPLEIAVHMVGVGLVIAFVARRFGAIPTDWARPSFPGDQL